MKRAALIAVLALLTLPIAYNVVTSYVYDDDLSRLHALGTELHTWESFAYSPGANVKGIPSFRPITWFIQDITFRIFGRHFHLYHAFFFACHLSNGVLLYLLALRLTHNRPCALVAGLLFVFNQANTETLCLLYANHMIHGVTFTLLTLLSITLFRDSGRRVHLLATVLFFNMAVYSTETCVVLLLYVPLLVGIFALRQLRPADMARASVYILSSTAILLTLWFASKSDIWAPASVVRVNYRYLAGNVRWVVVNLFLPFRDMRFSPSDIFFPALYYLLGFAYLVSFSQFILLSRIQNKLFVFGVSCFLLYVVPVSKFIVYERVLYYACPFYALVIGSLLTVEARCARRGYRISVAILCALLLVNNYALLLLRTRDWSTSGRLTRNIMRYFGDQIDAIHEKKLHAVDLYPCRLLYLRGKPLFGPIDDMYRWCLWFNGRDPGELPISEENLILWRDAREIALAFRSGGPVQKDDPLIALEKERNNGSYRFRLYEGTVGDFLRGRHPNVAALGSSFPIRVNFQLIHSFVPLPGYEIDEGKKYQPWRGYGWDTGLYGEDLAFQRRACVDPDAKDTAEQLRETYVFTQGGKATWRIDLPNGDYLVSLCWGDPDRDRPPQTVTLQGNVAAESSRWMRPGEFVTAERIPVSVRDGRMVMELVPRAPNHPGIINHLVIDRAVAPAD